jgi:ankyrin repeat protein
MGSIEAFHVALARRYYEYIQHFLDKKPMPVRETFLSAICDNGMTPLAYACTCGDVRLVTLLLEAGANVTAKDPTSPHLSMQVPRRQTSHRSRER